MRRFTAWALAPLLSAACSELGAPESAICGNGVVEPSAGEDCEGSTECWQPGTPRACLFDCGGEIECPDGYACGNDKACRQSGYELEPEPRSLTAAPVAWMRPHDFEGDGRDEIVWIEATPGAVTGTLVVAGLESQTGDPTRWEWAGARHVPGLGDVDGDGLDDIVLPVGPSDGSPEETGALILLNDGARGFAPAVVAEDWAERPYGRLAAIPRDGRDELAHQRADGMVSLATEALIADHRFIDDGLAPALFAVSRSRSVDASCATPRLAVLDGTTISSYARCDGMTSGLPEVTAPPPGFPGVTGDFIALQDIDGDDRDDLVTTQLEVVGDGDGDGDGDGVGPPPPLRWTLVAAHGVGDGTFHSTTPVPPALGDGAFASEPLVEDVGYDVGAIAFGHVNDDGVIDLLTRAGVRLSESCDPASPQGCPCGPTHSCPIESSLGWGWHENRIVDLDGDGRGDIVGLVGQPARLAIWHTEGNGFTEHLVDTRGAYVVGFDIGDFDGDVRNDVLVGTVAGPGDSSGASIEVVWGDDPQVAAHTVATDLTFPGNVDTTWELRASPPVTQGFTGDLQAPDRIAALVAETATVGSRSGVARFVAENGRMVAPAHARQAAPNTRTTVRAWVGDFGAGGDGAGVLLSTREGTMESLALRRTAGVLEPTNRASGDAWASLAPYPGWTSRARTVVGDLDADGVDDLVLVGSPSASPSPTGPTWIRVASASTNPSEWVSPGWGFGDHVIVGSSWPDETGPGQAELSDYDGDGLLDLIVMGTAWTPPLGPAGGRVAAVFRNDGALGFEAPAYLDIGARAPDLQAWTVLGLTTDGTARVALVGANTITVGEVDPDVGGVVSRFEVPAPTGVEAASAADVDADGVTDLVLAGAFGTRVLWGVPHHGPLVSEVEMYDGDGAETPDAKPAGDDPPLPRPVVFLNYDGVSLEVGEVDATVNTWAMPYEAEPFGTGAKRDAITTEFMRIWEPFDLAVTDERPGGGDYIMIVIEKSDFPNEVGSAYTLGCIDNPRGLMLIKADPDGTTDPALVASIAAWGVGLNMGLSTSSDPRDLMAGGLGNPAATWVDECLPVDPENDCTPSEGCDLHRQNSYRVLLDRLGPG